MAGAVDTSVLFAALHRDDVHHERAKGMLREHSGIEVPPAILTEVEMLVRKKADRRTALDVLGRLLAENPHLGVLDRDLHPESFRIWKEYAEISYADAVAIAAALALDGELVTLDKRQADVWRTERRQRTVRSA